MRSALLLLSCLLLPGLASAAEGAAEERVAAYNEFRAHFDAGEYPAALPLAIRVVDLTQEQFGENAPEMANPLSNLGTSWYRMGEYGRALDTYRRAVDVLDLYSDRTDLRLVRPLHGQGAALLHLDRGVEAVEPLKRAIDILRNRDGLRSRSQLPVLAALVDAYTAAGRIDDAEREQVYAYNIAEVAWGRDSVRLVGLLMSYAQLKEADHHYTAARLLYSRAAEMLDKANPGTVDAIPALRGIARCFRLAYVHGESREAASDVPAVLVGTTSWIEQPTSEGERALQNALQRLEATESPDPAIRGAVLVDLGDWYLTSKNTPRALSTWRDAWRALAEAGDTTALDEPAPVTYRAPQIAVSRREEDPETHVIREVQVRMGLDENGKVLDTSIANPDPASESAERAVVTAARRADWRPAFLNGSPVATGDYVFSEFVYVKPPR